MHSLELKSDAWKQPEDRDHPAVLIIIAMVCVAMFCLVCVYG
jgi:hypothetical protein